MTAYAVVLCCRGIQDWHITGNGWCDIGYSFLVGGDGNVYEGRGWDEIGAHTGGFNSVVRGAIGAHTGGFNQGWASVLFKRTFRSLRSFAFFIKERSVLCVLLHSL